MVTGEGKWQTGQSTKITKVNVSLADGIISIAFPNGKKVGHEIKKAVISSRMSGIPLKLNFADGTILTIPDGSLADAIGKGTVGFLDKIETNFLKVIILLLALSALSVWAIGKYILPSIAHFVAERLPVEIVNNIGEEYFETLHEDMVISDASGEYKQITDQALADILAFENLTPEEAGYDFKFFVFDVENSDGNYDMESTLNAFALPNGHIIFGRGALEVLNEEEIYAVAVHEISHVIRRHSMQGFTRALGWYAIQLFMFGDISALVIPAIAFELGYSRTQEAEADCDSAKIMQAQGRNPYAVISALDALMSGMDEEERAEHSMDEKTLENEHTDSWWQLLSTHPTNHQREELIASCLAS